MIQLDSRDILKTPNLRVAIYNRTSTTKEEQNNALETQIAESQRIAENLGWIVIGHYIEQETATSITDRTEYKRLIHDMSLDKFDVIMVKSQDRIMRNNKDWYELIELLTKYKKGLYFYLDNQVYDCNNEFVMGIMMQIHAQFSRNLSAKIREAHEIRQRNKSGLNITGKMFGWTKVGKDEYVINEDEAYWYRKGFEMLREGKGFRTISNFMAEQGVISPKTGKRISQTSWRNMLTSSRAYGTVILRKYTKQFGTKKRDKVPKEEQVVIENALPPIVSKEYFEETQKLVRNRITNFNRKVVENRDLSNVGKYPLSHKIYCGECGATYYRNCFHRDRESARYIWKCNTVMQYGTKKCDSIVIDEKQLLSLIEMHCDAYFNGLFDNKDDIISDALAYIKKILKKDKSSNKLESLKDKLDKQLHKKQVLFDKLMEEVISDSDFKIQNEKLSAEISRLEGEVEKLTLQSKSLLDYEDRLSKIKAELETTDIIGKAKSYGYLKLIHKIIVNKDSSITIKLDKYKFNDLFGLYSVEDSISEHKYEISFEYKYETKYVIGRNLIKLKILDLYRENSNYVYEDISKKLGCTASYVYTCVQELKSEGRVSCKFLGNSRKYNWTVLEDKETSEKVKKYYSYFN